MRQFIIFFLVFWIFVGYFLKSGSIYHLLIYSKKKNFFEKKLRFISQ
jgi:hypothetical protein